VPDMVKDAGILTATSLTLGVGANVTTQLGGNASGLNAFGSMLPVVGTTLGAKHVFNTLEELTPKDKKKKGGIL